MIKLTTYNYSVDRYLKKLQSKLKRNKIQLRLSLQDYVLADSFKVNGYFDECERVLAVSVNRSVSDILRLFVHEGGHFSQWKEQCASWKKYDTVCGDTPLLSDWIEKKINLTKQKINDIIESIKELELDCEKRALQTIEQYDLPLNKKEYCRKANAYVMFYNFVKEERVWYKIGKEPYLNKKILDQMPDSLDCDHNALSDTLRLLYKECI